MFDNEAGKGKMYHCNDCAAADTQCVPTCKESGHGIEVTFSYPINLKDLIIQTRAGNPERYVGVCLYADQHKVACTPESDYVPESNNLINFADFYFENQQPTVIASTLTLKWEGTATGATIEELFIDYTVGMLYCDYI